MAKIRCGRPDIPRHHHESVDAARRCQRGSGKPTQKMIDFACRLGGDVALIAQMSYDECSAYIDNLRKGAAGAKGMTVVQPKKSGGAQYLKWTPQIIMSIPEGYFAMPKDAEGTQYEFWRVGVMTEGEGDQRKVRTWRLQSVPKRKAREQLKLREVLLINNEGVAPWVSLVESMATHINEVLKKIVLEGRKMQIIYGRQEGFCGVCGKELSDPQSVALGIGPKCLKDNPGYLDEIRELDGDDFEYDPEEE